MNHVDFLATILMDNKSDYWVVAKEAFMNEYGRRKRQKDYIIMLSIPYKIQRGLKREDIKLVDLEELLRSSIDCNVYLNADYPPFQLGQTFYDVYIGFPITCHPKEFLKAALELNSDSIYDYHQLIKKLSSEPNAQVSDTTEADSSNGAGSIE